MEDDTGKGENRKKSKVRKLDVKAGGWMLKEGRKMKKLFSRKKE